MSSFIAFPAGAGSRTDAPTVGSGPGIASFLKIRTPGGIEMTSDGSVYFLDFPDGVTQLYRRAPGDPINAQGKRLTDFKDGVGGFQVSPDEKHLVFAAAPGGNEQFDLYHLNPATDEIKPLLVNSDVAYGFDTWLRDSSGFLYRANDQSPRDFFLYHFDLKTGKSTNILSKPGSWSASDVTIDGKRALVGEFRSISDSRAYELDLTTGALTDISATPPSEPTSNNAGGYLGNDSIVSLVSDKGNGINTLFLRDRKPDGSWGELREPLPHLSKFEIGGAATNNERTLGSVTHNVDGYGMLTLVTLPDFKPLPTPEIEKGLVGVADIQGRTLLFTNSNARKPGIVFAYDIPADPTKTGPAPRAITARMDREPIDLTAFRLPELIKYKSFDGVEIPAFLYLPEGAKKGKPIPFVINFHGGPEGQSRPGFSTTVQYLVSQGYGVMMPNVRGSTGYGRDFHMMDNYTKRWDSVRDGSEAARWLVKEGYSAPGKIAAYGGSYGGFMAVATVIDGADVFGASVNVVGVVNFITFLEQTKGYRQKLREAEYGPLSDPEFLKSVSPLNRIDEIKVPMLIAHGLNDPRVPIGEALQLDVGLKLRGHSPELLVFPDEGHGFAKLENRILFSEQMVRFLDKHLKGLEPAKP
ncbi:MAG TPA: hypothetical protein DEB06_09690 [Phycisphaerales bacterium]|nr:hypothetical protein [Phycisphaerales bacterium]